MKLYEYYVDNGERVFMEIKAYKNKKELLKRYSGNAELMKIKDITNKCFTVLSPVYLRETLSNNGWGKAETELIVALMEEHMEKNKIKK